MTDSSAGDVIAAQLRRLESRLDGPARAKRDVLREVRHGLIDAAEDHRRAGLAPVDAARAAVADFGAADEVAADFQAELAARQTNVALLFLAALGPVSEVVSRAMWSTMSTPDYRVPGYLSVFSSAIDVLGWAASLVAVVCLLVLGLTARVTQLPSRVARGVGVSIGLWLATVTVGGIGLAVMYAPSGTGSGSLIVSALMFGAQGYLGWLAWRCVRSANRTRLLRAT